MRTLPVLVLGAMALASAPFFACDNTAAAPVDYAPLLDELTKNVMLPEFAAFASAASTMDTAVAALDSKPSADSLAAAQTTWRNARAAYRKLDALYFGPVNDLGIGDRIDSGPASASSIDAVIDGTATINASLVADAGGSEKGFLGMEYLLFSASSDVLPTLVGDGAPARRRALVLAMADEVSSSAQQLDDAWNPAKGGYATQIETAGMGSKKYPSQRAALDEVVGGVGYALELIVGQRLALPLGRKSTGSPMPALDPTSASNSAVPDMTATLSGIEALYDGGMSANVKLVNVAENTTISNQFAECKAKLVAIPEPFDTAVVSRTSVVQAAYNACDTSKTTWNTDITSALGATLLPTDNDGD